MFAVSPAPGLLLTLGDLYWPARVNFKLNKQQIPTTAHFFQRLDHPAALATTTIAGRTSRPCRVYPFWNTLITVLGSTSGLGTTETASCSCGSKGAPCGSTTTTWCRATESRNACKVS